MYAVRVRVDPKATKADGQETKAAQEVTNSFLDNASRDSSSEASAIPISAGNPRVEHVTGVVHLYKEVPSRGEIETGAWKRREEENLLGSRLFLLALPPSYGAADICSFVGPYLRVIREMRLVRREDRRVPTYSVLLGFDTPNSASRFYSDFDGKPFSNLEADNVCRLLYVKDVELTVSDTIITAPPPGQTELPSCPVCLERLDRHISGVVTTVCNHMFHPECLKEWVGSSCPVCRYCSTSEKKTSHCTVCQKGEDLWICLICGNVGCGRYSQGHASDHWKRSGHCYALETETQRVWDYASDGYVHRLIQSKADGKLVEVPTPGNREASPSGGVESEPLSHDEKQLSDALYESKMDHVRQQYEHLLLDQLEQQRAYYEELMAMTESERGAALQDIRRALDEASVSTSSAVTAHKETLSKLRSTEKKLSAMEERYNAAKKEAADLQAQVDAMLGDHTRFNKREEIFKACLAEKDKKIKDLEEQVHDFAFALSATEKLASEGGEALEGTLLPVPEKPKSTKSSKKK